MTAPLTAERAVVAGDAVSNLLSSSERVYAEERREEPHLQKAMMQREQTPRDEPLLCPLLSRASHWPSESTVQLTQRLSRLPPMSSL